VRLEYAWFKPQTGHRRGFLSKTFILGETPAMKIMVQTFRVQGSDRWLLVSGSRRGLNYLFYLFHWLNWLV
jgi:hypothetical protein